MKRSRNIYNANMRRQAGRAKRLAALAGLLLCFCLLLLPAEALAEPEAKKIITVAGDAYFPPFEFLDEAVDASQLAGNVDLLRAMRLASAAGYAVVCLTQARNRPVVTHEERLACLAVVLGLGAFGNIALIDTFIIMEQNAGNVEAVRTGHAVFAVITRNSRILADQFGRLVEI